MNDAKQQEPTYSIESTAATTVESPPQATEPIAASETKETGQPPNHEPTTHGVALPEIARTPAYGSLADFQEFLKRTKRVWLIVAGAIFGLIAVVTLVERVSEWARSERERRHEQAVATVTPATLVARCGQPAQDVTREVYPILMRTMTYQPKDNETLVMAFSRTAEEQSDWVFLSMKDENRAANYDTPEAKIAALPCMDSKK